MKEPNKKSIITSFTTKTSIFVFFKQTKNLIFDSILVIKKLYEVSCRGLIVQEEDSCPRGRGFEFETNHLDQKHATIILERKRP